MKNPEGPERETDVGLPIELLFHDFMCRAFGADKVMSQPGQYPDKDQTRPDDLVQLEKANRNIYVDVTVSPLRYNFLGGPSDPKGKQRRIFAHGYKKYTNIAGIVVYQQHVMLPDGYYLAKEVIEDLAYDRTTQETAQNRLDRYCRQYRYDLYSSGEQDWEQVAQNLRAALGL